MTTTTEDKNRLLTDGIGLLASDIKEWCKTHHFSCQLKPSDDACLQAAATIKAAQLAGNRHALNGIRDTLRKMPRFMTREATEARMEGKPVVLDLRSDVHKGSKRRTISGNGCEIVLSRDGAAMLDGIREINPKFKDLSDDTLWKFITSLDPVFTVEKKENA